MSADPPAQPADDNVIDGGKPQDEKVESRAEGRPPEERSSEDAKAQAEAILEESDERVAERSAAAEGQEPASSVEPRRRRTGDKRDAVRGRARTPN